MDVLKKIDPLVALVGTCSSLVAFVCLNFATIAYVDKKHAEAIAHSDMNFERSQALLLEIKDTAKSIENRTWDLQKEALKLQAKSGESRGM